MGESYYKTYDSDEEESVTDAEGPSGANGGKVSNHLFSKLMHLQHSNRPELTFVVIERSKEKRVKNVFNY